MTSENSSASTDSAKWTPGRPFFARAVASEERRVGVVAPHQAEGEEPRRVQRRIPARRRRPGNGSGVATKHRRPRFAPAKAASRATARNPRRSRSGERLTGATDFDPHHRGTAMSKSNAEVEAEEQGVRRRSCASCRPSCASCRSGSSRRATASSSSSRAATPPARAGRSARSPSASARACSGSWRCPRPPTARRRRCTCSATWRTSRRPARSSIFDRSWYNRAGVEHVMGFCTQGASTRRFLEHLPAGREADRRQRHPADQALAGGRPGRAGAAHAGAHRRSAAAVEAVADGPRIVAALVRVLARPRQDARGHRHQARALVHRCARTTRSARA